MKADLKSMTIKEMELFFEGIGEKKYRGKQVFSWIHKGAADFSEMTNLSLELREKLEAEGGLENLALLQVQESKKDGTRKYLLGLSDKKSVEAVFMKYKYGNSICISSQAGCRMGCSFCASGIGGLQRNLTAGEMVDQILTVERDTGAKIGNVVVMGTGEPFDNYENLSRFIKIINEKEGLNIGMRSITVSTCGIIPKMNRFAEDFPQVNLAVSLHASDDEARSRMMPVNKSYGMDELLKAARDYVKKTGRRITFEYALVKGVNDGERNAQALAAKLRGLNCHVNLIPLNKVSESGLETAQMKSVDRFKQVLERESIPVTVRRELGSDIDAACGQLRLKNSK